MRQTVTTETPTHERIAASVERWVFTCPIWLLALTAVTALSIVYSNLGPPPEFMAEWAADPFTNHPDVWVWLYQSPLGILLAWVLQIDTTFGISALQLAVTWMLVTLCAALLGRWHSPIAGRLFVIAYFASAAGVVSTSLLGWFDIIVIAALTIVVAGPVTAVGVAALVLGFQHFEQGAFGIGIALLARFGVRREPVNRPMILAALTGLLAGRLLLQLYVRSAGVTSSGRMEFLEDRGLLDMMTGGIGQFPVVAWSVYGVMWVPIWIMLRESPTLTTRWFVALQLAAFGPVLLTVDLTRVYAALTWPLLMVAVLWWAEPNNQVRVRRWTPYLLAAALIVPRIVVWEHRVTSSNWGRL